MNHSNFFIQSLTSLVPVGFAPAILIATAVLISTATVANTAIEEVIVTADFRDASLLKTAASITVFDSQTITRRQARHLEKMLNLAPNVNFSSGASRGRFLQIRGIGERSQFIEPLNPSVGILKLKFCAVLKARFMAQMLWLG
jgi:iron complex outermembrane receptor protein